MVCNRHGNHIILCWKMITSMGTDKVIEMDLADEVDPNGNALESVFHLESAGDGNDTAIYTLCVAVIEQLEPQSQGE